MIKISARLKLQAGRNLSYNQTLSHLPRHRNISFDELYCECLAQNICLLQVNFLAVICNDCKAVSNHLNKIFHWLSSNLVNNEP